MPHSATVSSSSRDRELRAEELLRKAQHARRGAASRLRQQVVIEHRDVATAIARRYGRRGVEREDLEQVALLGLVQAVRRYRPEHGSRFLAFAVPTITGELKRYFRDHGWAVRPPRRLQERSLAVRSCVEQLTQELGREPTHAEIAVTLGVSTEDVLRAEAVDAEYVARSMDAPVDRDSGTSWGESMGVEAIEFDRVDTFATLRPLLRRLSARERLIVRLRFVDNLTQRQIGRRIGVSQMQVSRLLADVLARLRRGLDSGSGGLSAAS